MAQQLSTNTFGVAKWIVSSSASQGTHTTIAAAIASASSGDDIFIRPGTYTENLTLKAGVNLVAFDCDGFKDTPAATSSVTIIGKMSYTGNGTVKVCNVALQTNSDFLLAVTGSGPSTVYLENCSLICADHSGISGTSAAGNIRLVNCYGDLSITGINYFSISGGTFLSITGGEYLNSGDSTTASTWSANSLFMSDCVFNSYLASSGSSADALIRNVFFNTTGNAVILTHNSTNVNGSEIFGCFFGGATSSAISIGAGALLFLWDCEIQSANTHAITGAGTLVYGELIFVDTSSDMNVSTINAEKIAVGTIIRGTWNGDTIAVANGGTGATTLTGVLTGNGTSAVTASSVNQYEVVIGDAANAVTSVSPNTAGFVLTSNGTSANPTFQAPAAGGISSVNVQTFTTSGTYTPTAGMKYCTIEVVGGGGGGGGAEDSTGIGIACGSGGGAGGYARLTASAATIGASQTVTIGAGGAGGTAGPNPGSNGGTTSVGTLVSATGGTGGSQGSAANGDIGFGSPGGVGSSGDINISGGPGYPGIGYTSSGNRCASGSGGNSYFGSGGISVNDAPGQSGAGYGGGGSGAATVFDAAEAGGNGTDGVVIITEYV